MNEQSIWEKLRPTLPPSEITCGEAMMLRELAIEQKPLLVGSSPRDERNRRLTGGREHMYAFLRLRSGVAVVALNVSMEIVYAGVLFRAEARQLGRSALLRRCHEQRYGEASCWVLCADIQNVTLGFTPVLPSLVLEEMRVHWPKRAEVARTGSE